MFGKRSSSKAPLSFVRLRIAVFLLLVLFLVAIGRFFQLQVLDGEELRASAKEQRLTRIEIPAKRGKIFLRDPKSGQLSSVAINTTLYKISVDPLLIPDKEMVARELAELLYTRNAYEKCEENPKVCPEGTFVVESSETSSPPSAFEKKVPPFETVKDLYFRDILKKISIGQRTNFVLLKDVSDEQLLAIEKLFLPGIIVSFSDKIVSVDTTKISDGIRLQVAEKLVSFFQEDAKTIAKKYLTAKDVRYVPIQNRVLPDIQQVIVEKKRLSEELYLKDRLRYFREKRQGIENPSPIFPDYWRGVRLEEEYFRHYPEGKMASQIIGFVNSEGKGQYGIEEKMDTLLRGTVGIVEGESDVRGTAVGSGLSMQKAKDGADIVLTIDRIIQKQIEAILEQTVKNFYANSAQIIVIDPKTGNILAMAGYPDFDPNFYGDVYKRRRTTPSDYGNTIDKRTAIEKKDELGNFVPVKYDEYLDAWKTTHDPEFYVFENKLGPGAYLNKSFMEVYEPGSVMKPIVMAAAINNGEVTEKTTYYEDGPLEIGKYPIRNANNIYRGWQTMTNVLENSANLGMAFVSFRMQKPLLYQSLKSFGIGEYTNIEMADEVLGHIKPHQQWSDALLVTSSFGQGFSATPLQVIRAWTALANGGSMVEPHIVSEILLPDGTVKKTQVKQKRVITETTASILKRMLVSTVENGNASSAKVKGFYIAGKTGTSQIAKIDGIGYEDFEREDGNTVTSFLGFAPIENPKYLVLVKYDRPHVRKMTTGTTTAAWTFSQVMTFLLNYSNEHPDNL
jgi:cell division protein FtsI/penicillin-binding protein 2